jgi:hypothetical protein
MVNFLSNDVVKGLVVAGLALTFAMRVVAALRRASGS